MFVNVMMAYFCGITNHTRKKETPLISQPLYVYVKALDAIPEPAIVCKEDEGAPADQNKAYSNVIYKPGVFFAFSHFVRHLVSCVNIDKL